MRQGPHHDAQRFTTTTLPPKSARRKLPLSIAFSSRLRRLSGSAPSSAGAGGKRSGRGSAGVSITGSLGGGGLTTLLPDWAAAFAAKMRAMKHRGNTFFILLSEVRSGNSLEILP